MALLSVVSITLRQGRARRLSGVSTHPDSSPLSVWRTLSPASAASAVCHISFFVLWSLHDGLPSDRSRRIHSLAPLRVCLACIALKLIAQPSGSDVYPMRHRRCACRCCKFRHRGRKSLLRMLLLRQHLRFGDKPCRGVCRSACVGASAFRLISFSIAGYHSESAVVFPVTKVGLTALRKM